jgi:hypothetical protein
VTPPNPLLAVVRALETAHFGTYVREWSARRGGDDTPDTIAARRTALEHEET